MKSYSIWELNVSNESHYVIGWGECSWETQDMVINPAKKAESRVTQWSKRAAGFDFVVHSRY